MIRNNAWRLVADLIFFCSILFLPIWVSVIIGTLFLFFFRSYYEYIAFFALADILYSAPEAQYHNFLLIMTAGSVVIFIFSEWLKKKLLRYNYEKTP